MRPVHRFVARLSLGLALVLLSSLAGCGGAKPITVTGTLLRGGQPVKTKAGTSMMIVFARAEDKISSTTYPAAFTREEGTYVVSLSPGKYKVGVLCPALEIRRPAADSPVYELLTDQKLDLDLGK